MKAAYMMEYTPGFWMLRVNGRLHRSGPLMHCKRSAYVDRLDQHVMYPMVYVPDRPPRTIP